MAKFIMDYPVHPDRFNPNSVGEKVSLIAAFKRARLADPVECNLDEMKDFDVYRVIKEDLPLRRI